MKERKKKGRKWKNKNKRKEGNKTSLFTESRPVPVPWTGPWRCGDAGSCWRPDWGWPPSAWFQFCSSGPRSEPETRIGSVLWWGDPAPAADRRPGLTPPAGCTPADASPQTPGGQYGLLMGILVLLVLMVLFTHHTRHAGDTGCTGHNGTGHSGHSGLSACCYWLYLFSLTGFTDHTGFLMLVLLVLLSLVLLVSLVVLALLVSPVLYHWTNWITLAMLVKLKLVSGLTYTNIHGLADHTGYINHTGTGVLGHIGHTSLTGGSGPDSPAHWIQPAVWRWDKGWRGGDESDRKTKPPNTETPRCPLTSAPPPTETPTWGPAGARLWHWADIQTLWCTKEINIQYSPQGVVMATLPLWHRPDVIQ